MKHLTKLFCSTLLFSFSASAELADGLYAAFETSMGGITCRLDFAEAPLTCANFVGLVEGYQQSVDEDGIVRSGNFYDGLIFHRVIDGFMIQGGDPLGTGTGGPGYAFHNQISDSLGHSKAGILSMANSGPNSNGSQFFITLAATTWLDDNHPVFGEVVEGMDTVTGIGSVPVDDSYRPTTPVVMNSVRIIRKGFAALNFDPTAHQLPEVEPLELSFTNGASGLQLKADGLDRSKYMVVESERLTFWDGMTTQYMQAAEAQWMVPVSSNASYGFFRGARIHYPVAPTNDIVGHTITLAEGNWRYIFLPEEGGGGICYVVYAPTGQLIDQGSITYWGPDPSYRGYFFYTDLAGLRPFALSFTYNTSVLGDFDGYSLDRNYSPPKWTPFSGPFSDTPPDP